MPRKQSWNILELGYTDVREHLKKNDTVMVTMGSMEKHGAHCPLGTVSFTAQGVVEKAAPLCDTLFTPLMPYGYSPHHMGRLNEGTGTITMSGNTYRSVIYDIAKSLIYHGYNKLLFVTHHGSNSKVIDEILRRIRYESGCFVGWFKTPTERNFKLLADLVDGPPEETPGWHAGEIETSTAWAYAPGTIDIEVAKPDRTHPPKWMSSNFSKHDGSGFVTFQGEESMWVPMEHHEYSDTATIGNPLRASKEKGEKLLERAGKCLADLVNEIKKFDIKVSPEKREFNNRA